LGEGGEKLGKLNIGDIVNYYECRMLELPGEDGSAFIEYEEPSESEGEEETHEYGEGEDAGSEESSDDDDEGE